MSYDYFEEYENNICDMGVKKPMVPVRDHKSPTIVCSIAKQINSFGYMYALDIYEAYE